MLVRERIPFEAEEEPPPPFGWRARLEAVLREARGYFNPDEGEEKPAAAKAETGFLKTLSGLWRDPLYVRLPFEDKRLGLTLAAVLGIVFYLAFLAIAAHSVFSHAAAGLDQDLGHRVTFEVLPDSSHPEDVKEKQLRASELSDRLKTLPGVSRVTRLSDEKMGNLLSPWLGKTTPPPDLPLPALLDVELDARAPASKAALEKSAQGLPGVMLDDHAGWQNALSRSARALEFTALSVLALGLIALGLTAGFAAQTHFYMNRDTIEILHLIGARDSAIARHMGIAVLRLSAAGAVAGLSAGVITLTSLYLCMHGLDLSIFPNFSLGTWGWIGIGFAWLLAAVFAIALCFVTAYVTVLRALRRLI